MALAVYQPEEMRRIGGGRGSDGEDFAGLGGAFAGSGMGAGSDEFAARYLQERVKGMSRATVSPKVNEMRTKSSPEYALAQALGVKTTYSGMAGTDVSGARKTLNRNDPFVSRGERELAQKRIDDWRQGNAGVPYNAAMRAAGLPGRSEVDYAGPDAATQNAFDAVQKQFGKGGERKQEVQQTRTPGSGGGSTTPTIPSSGDEAAVPPSVKDAQDATKAPVGATIGGSANYDGPTPSRETTKGPRLDTERGPRATGLAGTFEGGQQARQDADQRLRSDMSSASQRQRAKDYGGSYIGDAPDMDRSGIEDATDRQIDARKRGDLDAANKAQEDREALKMSYDRAAVKYYGQASRNQAVFGNPYGPDGGKTFELRDRQKNPELAPLGGYDEKYAVGARGGNPDARRGEPGYMEKEIVPVGPMTNKPAASKEEYDRRMKEFNAEGEAQKQRNVDARNVKEQETRRKNVEQLNKKYAGPIGRRVA